MRTHLLVTVVSLAIVAILVASGTWRGEPEQPPAPEAQAPDAVPVPVVVSESAPTPPAPDPLEEELSRLRYYLRKETGKSRRRVLDKCIELGPKAAPLLPDLREFVLNVSGNDALLAMTAIMRIEGSLAYFDTVLESKREDILRKLNPEAPIALKEALRWWKLRPELKGIRETCASLALAEAEAAAAIVLNVERAGNPEISYWLRIAFHLDPIPADLGPVIANRLRVDGALVGPNIACALHTKRVDYSPIREVVVPALLERIPVAPNPELGHLLPAIVNLDVDGPEVMGPILDLLDRPGYPADRALATLFSFGPRARNVVPGLVDRADRCAPKYRGRYVETLGRIASVEAVPALNRWMHDAPERVAVRIVEAVIRCDPDAETFDAVDVILDALRDPRWKVRASAVNALRRVENIPPVLARALRDRPKR